MEAKEQSIRMLQAKDVKEILGIAIGRVYKLMERPDFPAIRVSDKRYVIPEHAFLRWLEEQIEEKKNGTNICLKCGCKFTAEYPSTTKYCPECGKQIRAQQNRERVRRYREKRRN